MRVETVEELLLDPGRKETGDVSYLCVCSRYLMRVLKTRSEGIVDG